jgi:hypothetical protein
MQSFAPDKERTRFHRAARTGLWCHRFVLSATGQWFAQTATGFDKIQRFLGQDRGLLAVRSPPEAFFGKTASQKQGKNEDKEYFFHLMEVLSH